MTLTDLYQALEPAQFTKKKVILSMAQYELNHTSIEHEKLKKLLLSIIDLLIEKGIERIITIFPVVKPPKPGKKPVKMDRYYAYHRAFEAACSDPKVTLWWSPAAVFIQLRNDKKQAGRLNIAHDENFNVIPIAEKFKKTDNGNYYPHFDRKREVFKEMNIIYQKYESKNITPPKMVSDVQIAKEKTYEKVKGPDGKMYYVEKEITAKVTTIPIPDVEKTLKDLGQDDAQAEPQAESTAEPEVHLTPEWMLKMKREAEKAIEDAKKRLITGPGQDDAGENVEDNTKPLNVNFIKFSDKSKVFTMDQADPKVTEQLNDDDQETVACVIPMSIGNVEYPVQIDTGAMPNVMSRETAREIEDVHKGHVSWIKLDRPMVCSVANNQRARTLSHVIVPTMNFGSHELKIPFYILEECNQTFIIGTRTMKKLGIVPDMEKDRVTCQPPGEKVKEEIPFMKCEEYEERLKLNNVTIDKDYQEEAELIVNRANISKQYRGLRPGDEDNAGPIYKENLKKWLDELLKDGSISEEQHERGHR